MNDAIRYGKLTARCCLALLCAAAMLLARPCSAQLATSFYNVTGIETRQLPDAVRITIKTDGTVRFFVDYTELFDYSQGYALIPVRSLHLHVRHARPHLPAFVDIGAYPVDSAVISLGNNGTGLQYASDPQVDIEIRFYVPVTVPNIQTSLDDYNDPSPINPLQAQVKLGEGGNSIVITVKSDHRAQRDKEVASTQASQARHLSVTRIDNQGSSGALRVEALHAALTDLVREVSAVSGASIISDSKVAAKDISLSLPSTSVEALLHTLATGYGLTITRQELTGDGEHGDQYTVAGGGGITTVTTSLPLRYTTPEKARLLFPDFLLPFLHADSQHNALLVSGSPELVERLRSDLTRLDLPRPQVRITATLWEFASSEDARAALNAARAIPSESESLDTSLGDISIVMTPGQQRLVSAAITALETRGRVHLAARPTLQVASGETGTLFLGQSRYVTVLQQISGQQVDQALQIQVGTTLTVQPQAHDGDEILLAFHPKISTVDAVQDKTGLPTVGIREIDTAVRLQAGDTLIVASLDSDLDSKNHGRTLLSRLPLIGSLFTSHQRQRARTNLLVLVTAQKV